MTKKLILKKALLVEDEYHLGYMLTDEFVANYGPTSLSWVRTVKDALALLDEFKFQLIILDINLPDGNGIEILNKIKKDSINSIIFVFSINLEIKNICLRKGADAFFDKSKDFDILIEAIKNIEFKDDDFPSQ